MAAFAFSRMTWRGRDTVFTLYLATMMIPSVVLVLPQFALIRALGWVNTYAALIVPGLVSAFGVFLLRQSFLTLPKDFEEAAFVDGANYFTIFWRIVLPLSRPALATLAIFSFMGLWNSYLWPLFVARKENTMTLPVALAARLDRMEHRYGRRGGGGPAHPYRLFAGAALVCSGHRHQWRQGLIRNSVNI